MNNLIKFKVVIIGLGNIGCKYDINHNNDQIQTHAKAFINHPNFELLAGVDKDKENCNTFTKKYHIQSYLEIEEAFQQVSGCSWRSKRFTGRIPD